MELLVLLIVIPILWQWCRRDEGRTVQDEERFAGQTASGLLAIRDDLDRLIEMEIASLPVQEQGRWRRMLIEAKIGRLPAEDRTRST